MSFGPGGQILRPDPTRARVVDDTGEDVVVPLAPNTTVDTITGDIIPMPDGGTGGTTVTTGGGGTTTPSTPPPTTTTTQPPPTTTTTQPPPTTTTTTQPTTTTTADPGPAEP
jgi:serine/threonine-protein kinase